MLRNMDMPSDVELPSSNSLERFYDRSSGPSNLLPFSGSSPMMTRLDMLAAWRKHAWQVKIPGDFLKGLISWTG